MGSGKSIGHISIEMWHILVGQVRFGEHFASFYWTMPRYGMGIFMRFTWDIEVKLMSDRFNEQLDWAYLVLKWAYLYQIALVPIQDIYEV